MSKRRFTQEQVLELLKNVNVAKSSEKAITYSKDFKIRAVKQYHEDGLGARQIFRNAGFDLDVIGKGQPKSLMQDWNRIYKTKGVIGLATETRGKGSGGGRPKTKNVTDADKIQRLEAAVAYLKAENDFLAKLRARRRE